MSTKIDIAFGLPGSGKTRLLKSLDGRYYDYDRNKTILLEKFKSEYVSPGNYDVLLTKKDIKEIYKILNGKISKLNVHVFSSDEESVLNCKKNDLFRRAVSSTMTIDKGLEDISVSELYDCVLESDRKTIIKIIHHDVKMKSIDVLYMDILRTRYGIKVSIDEHILGSNKNSVILNINNDDAFLNSVAAICEDSTKISLRDIIEIRKNIMIVKEIGVAYEYLYGSSTITFFTIKSLVECLTLRGFKLKINEERWKEMKEWDIASI